MFLNDRSSEPVQIFWPAWKIMVAQKMGRDLPVEDHCSWATLQDTNNDLVQLFPTIFSHFAKWIINQTFEVQLCDSKLFHFEREKIIERETFSFVFLSFPRNFWNKFLSFFLCTKSFKICLFDFALTDDREKWENYNNFIIYNYSRSRLMWSLRARPKVIRKRT